MIFSTLKKRVDNLFFFFQVVHFHLKGHSRIGEHKIENSRHYRIEKGRTIVNKERTKPPICNGHRLGS